MVFGNFHPLEKHDSTDDGLLIIDEDNSDKGTADLEQSSNSLPYDDNREEVRLIVTL